MPPILVEHPLGLFQAWPDIVGHMLQTGVFWDEQVKRVLDAGDPGGWAIDLGANIGFHTVYLARRYAQVIAVEAHPSTYQLLVQNLRVNGVHDKVHPWNVAAYDRLIEMALAPAEWVGWPIPDALDLSTCTYGSSVAFMPTDKLPQTPLVKGVPIDTLVPPEAPIQVIKCDVQGCDLRALMGLERTIRQWRPYICYEVETGASVWHGDDLAAHEAWFTTLDYEVELIQAGLWDFAAWPKERGRAW